MNARQLVAYELVDGFWVEGGVVTGVFSFNDDIDGPGTGGCMSNWLVKRIDGFWEQLVIVDATCCRIGVKFSFALTL